jgi:hypothetical protein
LLLVPLPLEPTPPAPPFSLVLPAAPADPPTDPTVDAARDAPLNQVFPPALPCVSFVPVAVTAVPPAPTCMVNATPEDRDRFTELFQAPPPPPVPQALLVAELRMLAPPLAPPPIVFTLLLFVFQSLGTGKIPAPVVVKKYFVVFVEGMNVMTIRPCDPAAPVVSPAPPPAP